MVIASQKLVSRLLLPYQNLHSNHDIFYDEIVLIFFMDTIAKPHVKKLTVDAFLLRRHHYWLFHSKENISGAKFKNLKSNLTCNI